MSYQTSGSHFNIFPTILYIIAPIIGIGLLLCCNVLVHTCRRSGRLRRLADEQSRGVASTAKIPAKSPDMYEIWIEKGSGMVYLGDGAHDQESEATLSRSTAHVDGGITACQDITVSLCTICISFFAHYIRTVDIDPSGPASAQCAVLVQIDHFNINAV